jgi:hypothetical protein
VARRGHFGKSEFGKANHRDFIAASAATVGILEFEL